MRTQISRLVSPGPSSVKQNIPINICVHVHSQSWLCSPTDCVPWGSSVHGDSPGKNTRVGCHALLWGIFPTEGSNLGLVHCRRILYCLSHQGSLLFWAILNEKRWASWVTPVVKNVLVNAEDIEIQVRSLGWEDPLEEAMATHCSILAWRIPWTEEPCGLQSIGLQRVGHNWSNGVHTQLRKDVCVYMYRCI